MSDSRLDEILREMETLPAFAGMEYPIGVNTRGNFGDCPIHIAAIRGDCEVIRLLAEAGADINQRGEHGFSPLNEAASSGHFQAARLLIELGATPSLTDDGLSASALADDDGEMALWLKSKGY